MVSVEMSGAVVMTGGPNRSDEAARLKFGKAMGLE
jgi:hypothetical protein